MPSRFLGVDFARRFSTWEYWLFKCRASSDWIWGTHRFNQRACDSCIDNYDRRHASRTKPPSATEKRIVRGPLPKDDY